MKKLLTFAVMLLLVVSASAQQAKYVFIFIGDGLGINHVYGTELYNAAVHPQMPNNGRVSFSRFPIRTFVTNHSASSLVTDSSAAATAIASGVKTVNGYMGVDADKKPAKNVAELAAELGMATGVATNVAMNHATPSAFFAHTESRSDYKEIFDQYVASDIDFAAGASILCRRKSGITPQDCVEQAKQAGIKVFQNPREAAKVRKGRVMLLGNDLKKKTLEYANDMEEGDHSIVDYTAAAIDYFERTAKKSGFMLMVEAGHLDYCAHDNDAVTTFEEVNHLSQSVELALDFYNKYPEQTLIIVTADHETGGLSVGYKNYKMNVERLAWQKHSIISLTEKMRKLRLAGKTSWEDMQSLLRSELGFWIHVKLRKKDEQTLRKTFDKYFVETAGEVVSLYNHNERLASTAIGILNKRAYFDWISLDHTGAQVPLFVKGAGIEHFYECYDNTDIAKSIAKAIGAKMER